MREGGGDMDSEGSDEDEEWVDQGDGDGQGLCPSHTLLSDIPP